jgi:hypothetical protein
MRTLLHRRAIWVAVLAVTALVGVAFGARAAVDSSDLSAAQRPAPKCPGDWKPGWQRLADRIGGDVYCPAWLPDPLKGQIEGRVDYGGGGNILSVGRDGSYLESMAWAETGSGEVHVILRGYPHSGAIPVCGNGSGQGGRGPCFSDPAGSSRIGGKRVTLYRVNRGADEWHLLYAWHHAGGLYTVSQHVTEPYTVAMVQSALRRMLRTLVVVHPSR